MLKKGIFLLSLIATCNAYAQDVAPYTPGTLSEGIVYYLPKTELEIKEQAYLIFGLLLLVILSIGTTQAF